MAIGSNHRGTRACQLDGRRCQEGKCKKIAKDKINDKYLCRVHSPARLGYTKSEEKEK